MKRDSSATPRMTRLNQGRPIIAPDPNRWDSAFTLNPTAVYLERSLENDEIVKGLLDRSTLDDPRLRDGVVAIFYRGIPRPNGGPRAFRSFVGLAVFTPKFKLLRRFQRPVIAPTDDPNGYDHYGVEDARITRIDGMFYLLYCGFTANPSGVDSIQICLAVSADLINWRKMGPIQGDVNSYPNKDAALLPELVDGKYVMLHRPHVGSQSDLSIALAVSEAPTGPWKNLGPIMKALPHRRYCQSWVGAGSPPISLGGGRFLADYHTGNFDASGARDYFAGYSILNFNNFDLARPELVVESRCETVLFPETRYELHSPWPFQKQLNCVFPCGSYEYEKDIVMVYGGADAYVLAAKIEKRELLSRLLLYADGPTVDTDHNRR